MNEMIRPLARAPKAVSGADASAPNSCSTCFYFRAPNELTESQKAGLANSGLAAPRGQCRLFPRGEEKYGSDWCGQYSERKKNP